MIKSRNQKVGLSFLIHEPINPQNWNNMWKKKFILIILIVIVTNLANGVSYASQPMSKVPTTSNNASVKKGSTSVTLSFSLFQKLMNMKPTAVVQYLKQQGCKVEQSGDGIYSANVKGGAIFIYYPSYHSPRV